MNIKYLAAASAIALLPMSAPALAQHSTHGGMTMPMPEPKKPAPAKKRAAPKKKAVAKKTQAKKQVAAEQPASPANAQASPDQGSMDHGAMQMPAEPAATGSPEMPMDHGQMDHGQMDHGQMSQTPMEHAQHNGMPPAENVMGGHAMFGALGPYAMNREASGTAWQPDASDHSGIHLMTGDWMLMGHAQLNLVYDHQSGKRGDDKLFASGMLMGMARRPVGNGTLQFRAMLSPDPMMGKKGYPLLLASGETADGTTRLIDRQHPHDFLMELSVSVSQNIGSKSSVFVFGGLPGEPAFGPPAFMHREAILDSPEAPISHHWLDSTHISFGVLTAGLIVDRFKVEVSRFNGREPDQHRWNIETGPLDSTAVRVSWNPTGNLALQGSWGHFEDSEQLEPGVDQKRWSASALYARDIAPGWKLAGTLAWGRKTIEHHKDDAYVAEASLKHGPWTIFGRGEVTENRELLDAEEHGPAFSVGKISVGAIHDFKLADQVALGVGGLFAVNFVPDDLKPLYGGSNPIGAMGFVRLKIQ